MSGGNADLHAWVADLLQSNNLGHVRNASHACGRAFKGQPAAADQPELALLPPDTVDMAVSIVSETVLYSIAELCQQRLEEIMKAIHLLKTDNVGIIGSDFGGQSLATIRPAKRFLGTVWIGCPVDVSLCQDVVCK